MNRMPLSHIFLAILLAALPLAGGCSCGKDQATATGGDTATAGKAPVAVEVVTAALAPLTDGIDVVGTLAAKHSASVRPEAPGTVLQIYVDEWVPVAAGATLARLDTREADASLQQARAAVEAARAMVLQAEVGEQRAEREFTRTTDLKNYGLVTRQQLDDAGTARDAARAATSAARAQLKVAQEGLAQAQTYASKKIIRSPIAGVVAAREVNVGSVVSDKEMFRVVDNRVLNLTVSVPERASAALRPGLPIVFSTDALPGETFTATIKYVNPAVNAADRAVQVMAELDNGTGPLKDGMFVRGRIVTGGGSAVLAVPRNALVTWDLASAQGILFVVVDGIAHRTTVRTGRSNAAFVEITSGLIDGEQVVTGGSYQLQDGDRVSVTGTPAAAAVATSAPAVATAGGTAPTVPVTARPAAPAPAAAAVR